MFVFGVVIVYFFLPQTNFVLQMEDKITQKFSVVVCRVSEPACFGAAPAPVIFYPEPALAPGKRKNNVGIFKTDYELSKIRSNTCTSTYRSYFMFTLEKTSNEVKFHVICLNY